MFRAGELDQLITVKREVRTSDGMGGDTVSVKTVVSNLWAHVRPRSGKEMGAQGGVDASAVYLFVIRNRSDLKESDRLVWEDQTYNIRSILRRGARSMYLEIDAERGVTQ